MSIDRYHSFSDWEIFKLDDSDNSVVFGFELEIENKEGLIHEDDLSDSLEDMFGDLFIHEYDGSLQDGFEIISQPMSWNYFLTHIETFKKLLSECREAGYVSHDGGRCGLHVHINRQSLDSKNNESLTVGEVYKNIKLILERFQKNITKFSRRSNMSLNRWAKFLTELITLDSGVEFINKLEMNRYNGIRSDRYRALNECNSKTIEFRFLRGTLKWETFFISLNFLHNIVEASKIPNNFVDFKSLVLHNLSDDMAEYCLEFCKERDIDLDKPEYISLEKTTPEFKLDLSEIQSLADILD